VTTEEPRVSQPPPGSPREMPEPPDLPAVPDDADDTRGAHLRHLMLHPATLIVTGVLGALALVVVGTQVGFGIGAAATGGVLLIAFVVVWLIASSRAADDFFNAYARGRALIRVDGKTSLPPVTPLLRKGDRRYAEQRFNGVLPGALDGSLCLYTYEEESTDSDGDRQTTYIHYTVVMTELPDTARLLQELYCQRRFGFRFMDGMEDVFRQRQRVEQESGAVDKRYEIFIGKNDDMGMARQVLSPSFLVWLEEHSPEAYAFELCAGSLVCNVKGHKKSAAELDQICQASAAVARRLHGEATETAASPS
jgi:hypothetical protein